MYTQPATYTTDAHGWRVEVIPVEVTEEEARMGRQLLRELDAKWKGEGCALYVTGQDIDQCWNDSQRAGWLEAERNWNAAIDDMPAYPTDDEDTGPVIVTDEAINNWQLAIEF